MTNARMVEMRESGCKLREIAAEFGCSITTVHQRLKKSEIDAIEVADEPKSTKRPLVETIAWVNERCDLYVAEAASEYAEATKRFEARTTEIVAMRAWAVRLAEDMHAEQKGANQ